MRPLDLPGTWTFERRVQDRRGADFTVAGTAEFTVLVDGRIRWHESGTMTLNGEDHPVHRTLFLAPLSGTGSDSFAASDWKVTFEDGRFFHPWPAEDAGAGQSGRDTGEKPTLASAKTVVHVCTPDLYRGEFLDVVPHEKWTLVWNVSGPRKDYTMRTRYSLVASSTPSLSSAGQEATARRSR